MNVALRTAPKSNEDSRMRAGTKKMPLNQTSGADGLAALLGERAVNLRQTILRAHRGMNNRIVKKFSERGYNDIRPFHLSILANMNLGETSVCDLVERTQITSDGVRGLLADLVRLGYVRMFASGADAEGNVDFTDAGWELMLTSFNIQKELEVEFNDRLKPGDVEELRRILGVMFVEGK
jgi:DNA-binding MarR family transcriptional regulator